MQRAWLPGTGISWAHNSAVLTKARLPRARAGKADVRSAVDVKIALTMSSGASSFSVKIASVSSFAAAITSSRSSASTVIAPRIALNLAQLVHPTRWSTSRAPGTAGVRR